MWQLQIQLLPSKITNRSPAPPRRHGEQVQALQGCEHAYIPQALRFMRIQQQAQLCQVLLDLFRE